MKKVLRIILAVIIVVGLGILSFLYFGIYDEGVRAGTVLRISKKGVIWKTYEGQLDLESFGALKRVSPLAETFDFSVERDRDSIVKQLEAVALSGNRVSLRYIKRYAVFPWRGKTKYFVRGIGIAPGPNIQHEQPGPFRH